MGPPPRGQEAGAKALRPHPCSRKGDKAKPPGTLRCGVKLQTHPTSQSNHRGQGRPQRKLGVPRGPRDGSQGRRRALAKTVAERGQRTTRSHYAQNCIHTYTPHAPTHTCARVCAHPRSLTHVCKHVYTHTRKQTRGCHAKGRGLSRAPAPLPSRPERPRPQACAWLGTTAAVSTRQQPLDP